MKIGIVADTHYCSKTSLCHGTRIPALALERLEIACGFFKSSGADLIVCLGDVINVDDSDELNKLNLERVSKVVHDTGIQCICVMGNHDMEAFTPEEFSHISGFALAPLNITYGNCALHFLDANNIAEGQPYTRDNIDWTKCHVVDHDVRVLERAVQDMTKKHFFFFHQCIDPNVDAQHIIANAPQLREIIKGCGAKAVFQGHFHKGCHSTIDNIPYDTLAALCSPEQNDYRLIDTDSY